MMYITSVRQMVKVGTIFKQHPNTYKVLEIDYDKKEMLLDCITVSEGDEIFTCRWVDDWDLRWNTLISQHEPIKLEDLI